MKLIDVLRRTQEPARPEDQPGKSMAGVCAGQRCAECDGRRAVRAIGERPLCKVCYYREVQLGLGS